MPADPVVQPVQAALLEMGIQLGEAGDLWDRHQEVPAGIAD
jgi:hypothetical protein